jgi:hypothetical protein
MRAQIIAPNTTTINIMEYFTSGLITEKIIRYPPGHTTEIRRRRLDVAEDGVQEHPSKDAA